MNRILKELVNPAPKVSPYEPRLTIRVTNGRTKTTMEFDLPVPVTGHDPELPSKILEKMTALLKGMHLFPPSEASPLIADNAANP